MPRLTSVEYENVARICFELLGEGKSPSYLLVAERHHQLFGLKGSVKIVQEFISRWRKEVAEQFFSQRSKPGLPDDIVALSDQLSEKLWMSSLEKAEAHYEEQRAELERTKALTLGEVQQAKQLSDAAEKNALRLQADLAALQAQLAATELALRESRERVVQVETQLREKARDLVVVLEQATTISNKLETERARAEREAESARNRHSGEINAERARHANAIEHERQRHHRELLREQEVWRGERVFLQQQTDQIRQSMASELAAIKKQLEASGIAVEQYKSQATKYRDEAAMLRGKIEGLVQRVAANAQAGAIL